MGKRASLRRRAFFRAVRFRISRPRKISKGSPHGPAPGPRTSNRQVHLALRLTRNQVGGWTKTLGVCPPWTVPLTGGEIFSGPGGLTRHGSKRVPSRALGLLAFHAQACQGCLFHLNATKRGVTQKHRLLNRAVSSLAAAHEACATAPGSRTVLAPPAPDIPVRTVPQALAKGSRFDHAASQRATQTADTRSRAGHLSANYARAR
jgi:hypothetical protein